MPIDSDFLIIPKDVCCFELQQPLNFIVYYLTDVDIKELLEEFYDILSNQCRYQGTARRSDVGEVERTLIYLKVSGVRFNNILISFVLSNYFI